MRTDYKYIVLGLGGVGSAALYWLARRAGGEALGLEQFPLFHANGSSQDHSRIIRLAYDKAAYTALTPHTYLAWNTLEQESGVQVVTKTGGVFFADHGHANQAQMQAYAEAMATHGLPFERWDADGLVRAFPQFTPPGPVDVVFDAEAGIADPNKGNAAHIAMAEAYGATVLAECPVLGVQPLAGGGVAVQTAQGTFTSQCVVVAAGAWTDQLMTAIGQPLGLTVTQEQVTYWRTPHLKAFQPGRFPIFIYEGDEGYYGFPVYGEVATKCAIDCGGPRVTAQTRTFEADEMRVLKVEAFLRRYIPGFLGPRLYTKTCLYDMARDRDFILDFLPGSRDILVFSGGGHGYKFASLLGRIFSDLAIDGRTVFPISPFRADREAVQDSSYPKVFWQ